MGAAVNIMKVLTENHCDWTDKDQSILKNSSAFYGKDVHKRLIYGEYYYVEAMYKLMGFEPQLW